MRRLSFFCIAAVPLLAVFAGVMLYPQMLWSDSLRLMTNLEYRVNNNKITDKATGETRKVDNKLFWQIYNLDMQKELFPNLTLNGGGVFEENKIDTKVDGDDSDRKETAIRPYIDLQLNSPLLKATTGYHKNELKLSGSELETSRRFTKEYTGSAAWKPVELPTVNFYYSHLLRYNKPNSTEQKIDKELDSYQLESRYDYQKYQFDFSHMSSKDHDRVTGFETTSDTDIGTVRYYDSFQQGKFTLGGGVRIKRDQIKFSGSGERLVPTPITGSPFYNLDDPPPATANNIDDFITNQPLSNVNLLQDGAPQLSFGLNFRATEELDTIYVYLEPDSPLNNQASSSEVDSIKDLYSWSLFVSDDQINWTRHAITNNNFDVFENRFEISFLPVKAPFVKIAVTPLPTLLLPGKEIRLSNLRSFRTLPPDTSKFTTTDWKTDMTLNWKMSERTSSGYDFLYREETSDPFDDKRTLLNLGARLSHRINHIFDTNLRLSRTAVSERGEADRSGYIFSSSLMADYLETFSQSLIYSFTRQDDDDDGTGTTNALLLRNNLYLYEGWSTVFDTGYTWQNPVYGEDSNRTFVRVDNSIIPNQWMNFTLYYEISWTDTDGRKKRREESRRLIASWVPLASLSLNADILLTDNSGEEDYSSTIQQYSVNWAPFRDGTLQFSLSYNVLDDNENDDTWVISPMASWQINKQSLLTCDYSVGERDGQREKNEFDTFRMTLRIFY